MSGWMRRSQSAEVDPQHRGDVKKDSRLQITGARMKRDV